jgi:RNA polymerase sigma-70 factor (ECF subfamily)
MNKVIEHVVLPTQRDLLSEGENDLYLSENNNADALGEQLYRAYYTRIHRYFSFRVFDKSEADDLAQTVFLKIFVSLKSGIWGGAGDIFYIFTVARNTLIDYFRKSKHAPIVSDELVHAFAESGMMSGEILQSEQHESLFSAMKGLRAEEAEAVRLRYFADMDYARIAEAMEKGECAVRQLVHRGIKSLRTTLAVS